jgi:hypothetical protein
MTPDSKVKIVLLVQRKSEATAAASHPQQRTGFLQIVYGSTLHGEKRQSPTVCKRFELVAGMDNPIDFVVSTWKERNPQG